MSPPTNPFDEVPAPGGWAELAACAGAPDANRWFPEAGYGIADEVLAFCDGCAVRVECLDYAVRWKIDHGVWGGLGSADRRRLRRHLALVEAGHVQPAELVFLLVFIIVGLRLLGMAL